MPGLGWSEILLVAVLAIVVVGPKDLPRLLAEVGRWTQAARRAAQEFRSALDQLAREAEFVDLEAESRTIGGTMRPPPPPAGAGVEASAINPTTGHPMVPAPILPEKGGTFRPPAEEDELPPPPAAAGEGRGP